MTSSSPPLHRDPPSTVALKLIVVLLVSILAAWLSAEKAKLGVWPAALLATAIMGVGSYGVLKLAGVAREIWLCYALKVLSVTAYKALNVSVVIWATKDLGLGDKLGQVVFMAFGISMSVSNILAGSVTDALGIRRTMLIGVVFCILSRYMMTVSTNPYVAIAFGLLPVAIGEALCTPVLVAAVRKYTRPDQRTIAFSLFYAIMNLGFTIAYFVNDALQKAVGSEGLSLSFLNMDKPLSVQQSLIGASILLELLLLPLVLLMREGVEVADDGQLVQSVGQPLASRSGVLAGIAAAGRLTGSLFAKLLSQRAFYNLLIFLFIIGVLKLVFSVMDSVLGQFMEKEFGTVGLSCVGRINAVNGLLILVLAPGAAFLTQRFSSYTMVVVGGFITAASFLILAGSPEWFSGIAAGSIGQGIGEYLGLTGAVHPYFVMLILWQITLSIGEAIYSPRVYEYASSLAPKGQEASYSALAFVPLLLGKLLSGGIFLVIFDKVYPKTGPSNPSLLWTVFAGIVLAAPLALLVLRPWIGGKPASEQPS
jgi:MFS family permease